jgi:hypothetical protein
MPSPAAGALSQGSIDCPSCDSPRYIAAITPISRFVTQDSPWGSLALRGFAGFAFRGCWLLKFRSPCNQVGPLPISVLYTKCYYRASSSLLSQHCSTTVALFCLRSRTSIVTLFRTVTHSTPITLVCGNRRTGSSQALPTSSNQIFTINNFPTKTSHENISICSSRP